MKLVAEFERAQHISAAAARLHELGYRRLDAFTPFPMPELEAHLGVTRSRLNVGVFAAGISGAVIAFLIIWWTNAKSYPINVGGRPLNSFVTDIPIIFETTVLFAATAAYTLVLLLTGMPRLWDPAAEIDGIERTSIDRYWLVIDPRDQAYKPGVVEEMERCGALRVREVEVGT
jgi:hypothetical protein